MTERRFEFKRSYRSIFHCDLPLRLPICFVVIFWQFFCVMADRIFFIIGTDTGVGKTVFASLLTQRLRERGIRVAALKPICSG